MKVICTNYDTFFNHSDPRLTNTPPLQVGTVYTVIDIFVKGTVLLGYILHMDYYILEERTNEDYYGECYFSPYNDIEECQTTEKQQVAVNL